jgi:hypothetical protein
MSIVNRPEVSRPLTWYYVATTILVAALGLVVVYFYLQMPQIVGIIGLVVMVLVGIIMVPLVASIYRMKYTLTQKELFIKASILIGGTKRIPLETIESAERTLIPFGIRLFGATGYGGYYYFPNVGRAFMAITNFKDGVLIKTKQGNYLITPKNPENFIETIMTTAQSNKKKET